jgi:hypothetical protein
MGSAALERTHAARMERATGRNRIESRHRAVDLHQALAQLPQTRNRPHQPRGVGVLRRVDHPAHRSDLGDAAGVHHGHAIGRLGDHTHVVGDQHHRGAALGRQLFQEADDLRLGRYVERRGRLVSDDELWFSAQREGNHDTLAQPSR